MQPAISQVLFNFLKQTSELLLYEFYVKIFQAQRGKSDQPIKAAVLGGDTDLFTVAEAIQDFGLVIKDYYLGDPNDVYHPSRDFNEFRASNYDLIILGATNEEDEIAVLNRLVSYASREPLNQPILMSRRLRSTVVNALQDMAEIRTCLNNRKLALVANAVLGTVNGCILECGSFRGGTTVFMGRLLKHWDDTRKIYSFDTFEGMPAPVSQDGETVFQEGTFTETSLDGVRSYVEQHALAQTISLHKGLVQDTLPGVLETEREVSFALVDTDQYSGTIESLKLVIPRLKENGIIIVDDYNLVGVQQAVAEAKELHPSCDGIELSHNFFVMWDKTTQEFLSHCQPRS